MHWIQTSIKKAMASYLLNQILRITLLAPLLLCLIDMHGSTISIHKYKPYLISHTSSQFYFIHLQVKPLKFTTTVQMSAKQCGSENPLLMTGLHCNVLSFTLKWDLNLKFQCTDIVHAPVTANKRRIIAYFLSWNCGPKESSPIRILKYVRHKPSQQPNTVQNCKQQNTKTF